MLHRKNKTKNFELNDHQQSSSPLKNATQMYRWNYQDQLAFDTEACKKERKKGALAYAFVMMIAFALCFAILASALIWHRQSPSNNNVPAQDNLSTADVSDMLKPSTVLIYTQGTSKYGYGTGFFIRSDGYIATNYHLLVDAEICSVTLYSGKEFPAKIVGYSEVHDLAILKIDGDNYPVVAIGDSSKLREGDIAIAIGHPSGIDAPWSTTQGVVSALDRRITITKESYIAEASMIQTDAALNPGNSGGPLCNDRGEVIGIVTRKLNDTEGISFAIPINGAMEILNAILKDGNAFNVQSSMTRVRPKIGITGGTVQIGDTYTYQNKQYVAEKNGVLISSVDPTGVAKDLLFVCDIIIAFNGQPVTDMNVFTELLYQQGLGSNATVTVWRDGREVTVSLQFR